MKKYYIHPDRTVEFIKTIYIDTPEGKESKEISIILDEDTIMKINQELSELPIPDDKEYEEHEEYHEEYKENKFNSNGAKIQRKALMSASNYLVTSF